MPYIRFAVLLPTFAIQESGKPDISCLCSAPQLAEVGERGAELWMDVELQVLAEVGIVGVPNAGKSTLLSVVSAARPKIAAYPFTTLVPNLGVCELDFRTTVFADIPGLICRPLILQITCKTSPLKSLTLLHHIVWRWPQFVPRSCHYPVYISLPCMARAHCCTMTFMFDRLIQSFYPKAA